MNGLTGQSQRELVNCPACGAVTVSRNARCWLCNEPLDSGSKVNPFQAPLVEEPVATAARNPIAVLGLGAALVVVCIGCGVTWNVRREQAPGGDTCSGNATSLADSFFERALTETLDQRDVLRITITSFMDAYNFDVRQVMKSCVHFLLPSGHVVPFSAYNVLYRDGHVPLPRLSDVNHEQPHPSAPGICSGNDSRRAAQAQQ